MPALVVEPADSDRLRRNSRRAAFYCGAVASLARSLAGLGSGLVCRRGAAKRAVLALARESGARTVVWSAAYDAATARRQRALQSALEEAGIRALIVHDAPAVAPDETAAARRSESGLGYRALAPFFAAWSAQARPVVRVRPAFAPPALRSDPLPEPAEYGAEPGILVADGTDSEAGASAAFERFLHGAALQYAAAKNVPADGPTSRLSAALSFGTIAARTVLARLDERRADPFLLTEERRSLDALVRSLAQRDFFLQLAWFFEDAPDDALQPRMRGFPFERDHPALAAWRAGRTGYPLIDAGIAQLRASGWMHPRVRLVAASFLCFDLGVDWRVGRDAWELALVEDDAALANGNWQWVAGVGADLAQFPRIYNPRKQLRAFDPLGAYVRRWLPELARFPDADLLDPGVALRRAQLALPLYGGATYPQPVLDHEAAARAFLRRYAAHVRSAKR